MRVDVKGYSLEKKLSIEESARHLRYECLFEQATTQNAQAVAVAHQADDQVETVLMHILRGSGPTGIRGMAYRSFLLPFSNTIPLIRPLLGLWREEIDEYCMENGLHPRTDQTNNDPTYFRNRIRVELIPELATYNSRAKEHIWQLAQLAQEEDRLLELETEKARDNVVCNEGNGFSILTKEKFIRQPLAIQRRIIRKVIGDLRTDLRDIGFDAIEKATEFLNTTNAGGEWQLLDSLWITQFDDGKSMIYTNGADFSKPWPLLVQSGPVPCGFEGVTRLNDHWQLRAEIVRNDDTFLPSESNEEVCFDLAVLKNELILRTAKLGERIRPFGRQEMTQKLSDLFINRKVHRNARQRWPLLCCGEEILWVVGVKRTKYAPVTAHTEQVLLMRLERLN
jgi:tRNA(Ile)-lysidine synthase